VALIACHECARPISSGAYLCPGCGAPGARLVFLQQLGITLAVILILSAFFGALILHR
jgi:hypothetical protein